MLRTRSSRNCLQSHSKKGQCSNQRQFTTKYSSFKSKTTRFQTSITQSKRSVHTASQQKQKMDVLIVGGGMVGASFACALGSTPISSTLKIGIIEEGPSFKEKAVFGDIPELRVSSINHSSVSLFKAIGVWDTMLSTNRIAPFYSMEVWDSSGPGSIHFDNSSLQSPELGFVVENKVIQSSLNEKIKTLPHVHIFSPASVQDIQIPQDKSNQWITVSLKDGTEITTRLLVGADGKDSIVRTAANIPSLGYSYNQKGVVCAVEHSTPNTTAWQRFLPSGPVALLPMFGNYSSIVWSSSPSHVTTLLQMSDEEFLIELQRAFTAPTIQHGWRFDEIVQQYVPGLLPRGSSPQPLRIEKIVGKRAAFPFRFSHAVDYIKPRVAVIGDAAHTVHPLAGQGVNMGFADSAILAKVIIDGLETGQDIGSLSVLQQYQNQRYTSNAIMSTGIDVLKRLFGSSFFPIALARNVGLAITDTITPIKVEFAPFSE